MNGRQLAAALADELGISVLKARNIVKAYHNVVGKALQEGNSVTVRNLYRLEPHHRQIRHPSSALDKRVTVRLRVSPRFTDQLTRGHLNKGFHKRSESLAGK